MSYGSVYGQFAYVFSYYLRCAMDKKYLIERVEQEQSEIDELNKKLNLLLTKAMQRNDITSSIVNGIAALEIIDLFNDMLRASHRDRFHIEALVNSIKSSCSECGL
jgi:translation initiation factor 2 beta subunit (eIF-2beta)/eIF-5